MAYKVFTNGSVLQASEVNDNLMNQSVIYFTNVSARTAAIPSPIEGMVTYMADSDTIQIYDGSAWKTSLATTGGIVQVVSTSKTDTYSMSTSTFTDITGFSASITPKSSSNKILVLVDLKVSANDANVSAVQWNLVRGATDIYIGDADGTRQRSTFGGAVFSQGTNIGQSHATFLDSPATTSATTYKVQIRSSNNGAAVFVNRSWDNTETGTRTRTASSITLMEVSA